MAAAKKAGLDELFSFVGTHVQKALEEGDSIGDAVLRSCGEVVKTSAGEMVAPEDEEEDEREGEVIETEGTEQDAQ